MLVVGRALHRYRNGIHYCEDLPISLFSFERLSGLLICKSLENVVFSCEDYKSKTPSLRCQRQWFVEDVRYIDNIQPILSLSLPLRTVLK